jgi:hypothetical protein
MRASIRLTVACLLLVISTAPPLARPMFACSPVPGYNPVSDSDLIVAGRFLGWERTGETAPNGDVYVRLRLAVDQVFKGGTDGDVITLSHRLLPDGRWGIHSCDPFGRDPTGTYVLIGLRRLTSGDYAAWSLRLFASGADSGSAAYRAAVARLARSGESSLSLADPRPCIPETGTTACTPERRALWQGDAAAWAVRGIADDGARFAATIALRAEAGDQATLAALARSAGQPYVQLQRVRYLAEPIRLPGWVLPSEEFVELFNYGSAPQELTGWMIHSPDRGIAVPLPAGSVLAPGRPCKVTVVRAYLSCGMTVHVEDLWPDDAGRVVLVDAEGVVRADVRYSADPYNQPPPPNLEGVRLPR